jgi:hypothetical protein
VGVSAHGFTSTAVWAIDPYCVISRTGVYDTTDRALPAVRIWRSCIYQGRPHTVPCPPALPVAPVGRGGVRGLLVRSARLTRRLCLQLQLCAAVAVAAGCVAVAVTLAVAAKPWRVITDRC